MHSHPVLGFAAALLISATSGAPLDGAQMGSKHNLYLSTCTHRTAVPSCPLIIICRKEEAVRSTYSAVAYYANGPSKGNPTEIATVSDPVQPWEGTLRVAKFRTSSFSSNIDAGAASLDKSAIAGTAKMDNEDFVCFRDGQTAFSTRVGGRRRNEDFCLADYWCASLSV